MDLAIALPKGRLLEPAVQLLNEAGMEGLDAAELSLRGQLNCKLQAVTVKVLLVRDDDVPTYVRWGATDLGVVGKDVLDESREEAIELLDLKVGECRLSLAVPLEIPGDGAGRIRRIATKYPRTSEEYFRKIGWQVEIIKLHGAVELAPALGLADAVVDLVATGNTLRQAGLVEKAIIAHCSARLIANRASFRLKSEEISAMENALRQCLKRREALSAAGGIGCEGAQRK